MPIHTIHAPASSLTPAVTPSAEPASTWTTGRSSTAPDTASHAVPHRGRLLVAALAPSFGLFALLMLPGPVGTALCLLLVGGGLVMVASRLRLDDAGGSVTLMTGGYCLIALLIAGVQAVA